MILQADGHRAVFDLANGARLASLQVDGHELLVSHGDDDMRWGSYPMAPWAGRIADGRFTHEGVEHQLPLNLAPHAIHGTAFDSSWSLDNDVMTFELGPPWPFGGRLRQRAELDSEGLTIELLLTAGETSMPAMVGWHPWFRRTIDGSDVEVSFDASSMFELDASMIPTGRLVKPSPPPWDNTFTDLSDGPRLRWPGVLNIELISDCRYWTVYTEPEHAVCVEPQTAAPDAFNRAGGPSPATEALLAAGDTLTATFTIRWSPDE